MGVIVPLNDILAQKAPSLTEWMKKRPEIRKAMTSLDGKIYYFPMFDEEPLGNYPLAIREDWLNKLNLKVPVTTEEWYQVWKEFKTKDPNGNGKSDEIPFSASYLSWYRMFSAAWGVVDDFYVNPRDGGKASYGKIDDRYREAIAWMARMYSEGLVDKEIATNDAKAFTGKVAQDLVGSFRGPMGSNLLAFANNMPEQIPGFKVVGTEPLKGPYGDQVHPRVDQSPRGGVIAAVITSENKYPEETVEWIDYFYSKEGAKLVTHGIEGKTYVITDGNMRPTEFITKNPDGLSSKEAFGTVSFGQGQGPFVFLKGEGEPDVSNPITALELDTKARCIPPFLEESKKFLIPGALSFESADDSTRRQIMADIQTYVDEMTTKFIIGQEPMENWDKYVEKVKGMGIDKVIEIYQKALDIWNKF